MFENLTLFSLTNNVQVALFSMSIIESTLNHLLVLTSVLTLLKSKVMFREGKNHKYAS